MQTIYLQVAEHPEGGSPTQQFWCVEPSRAYRLGIYESERHAILIESGKDMITTLQGKFIGSKFIRMNLTAGEFFPRMARPRGVMEPSPGAVPYGDIEFVYSRTKSTGQLHAFIEQLQQICQNVHPEGPNLHVYGHAIRNLLILACTEVELHWRNILQDNGYRPRHDRFTTNDYVKLLKAMRLGEYFVSLNYYPWMPTIAPFASWDDKKPSQSLPWYDAYNAVKHDRETNFAKATLEKAIAAVTACFVMLCAQYGLSFVRIGEDATREFFRLIVPPNWDVSERYVPPDGAGYKTKLFWS